MMSRRHSTFELPRASISYFPIDIGIQLWASTGLSKRNVHTNIDLGFLLSRWFAETRNRYNRAPTTRPNYRSCLRFKKRSRP